MNKYIKKITIGALAIIFCFPMMTTAQDRDMNQVEIIKKNEDRRAKHEKVKAEIEAIKNDPTINDEEKKILIRKKRTEFSKDVSQEMKEKKTNYRKGLSKEQKAAKREMGKGRKMKFNQKIKPQLDAIDADPNLSEEQKNESKKALLKAHKDEWKAKNPGGKLDSHGKGHRKGQKEHRAKHKTEQGKHKHKAIHKEQRDKILNDPSKTDAEKQSLLKAMKEENKATTHKAMRKEAHKAERRGQKGKKGQKENNTITKGERASDGAKTRTSRKLERRQKKLDKKFAKGKITEQEYKQKLQELNNLIEIDSKRLIQNKSK